MVYCLVEIFAWGCQLHGAKNMENQRKMSPNNGSKYPKCILTQKGWFLFISEDNDPTMSLLLFRGFKIISQTFIREYFRLQDRIKHSEAFMAFWMNYNSSI